MVQQSLSKRQQKTTKNKNNITNNNSSPPPKDVSAKLLHILRKLIKAIPPPHRPEIIHDALLENYKEYNRRNQAQLVIEIEVALKYLSSTGNNNSNRREDDVGLTTPAQKRKRDAADEKYERLAQLSDRARDGGASMLNAGLTSRYIRQSQDDIANRPPSPPAVVPSENASDTAMTSPPPTTRSTPSTTKKKKKKKRINATNDDDDSGSTPKTNPLAIQPSPRPSHRFTDLGGLTPHISQMRELILYPLLHPELFTHLGVTPPRGILLRGPPGTGKTHLAHAVAGELDLPFFPLSAPEIIGGVSGESEARVRELFRTARAAAPSLVFIDEIDAVAAKRGAGRESGMEKRIVAQLLTCMGAEDSDADGGGGGSVMVIGATNRADGIDPALRRAGRFDREICLGVPDEEARVEMLKCMTRGLRIDGAFDFELVAKKTPGYVGADLKSLTKEAAVSAVKRIFGKIDAERRERLSEEELEPLKITMGDFLNAVKTVQPSGKREGFATVPDVSWGDIGALQDIREELTLSVLEPINHPERFKALGLPLPSGVMLYGPPGCGKTLLAKAIANESGANFISVKGPELLDKYVGESERAVRQVFERARASSPCVVFFDELDSLCPRRGSDTGGGGVSERVVNQLLTEMDGLDERRSVFVIAATNRPELIDPAMMRPGRLDKLLYVPLPASKDRTSILTALSKNVNLCPTVDLHAIATSPRAEGYSGADCAALLREAGLAVLREGGDVLRIEPRHFEYAFDHVVPSVSRKDQVRYDRMRDRMARARTRGGVTERKEETEASAEAGV